MIGDFIFSFPCRFHFQQSFKKSLLLKYLKFNFKYYSNKAKFLWIKMFIGNQFLHFQLLNNLVHFIYNINSVTKIRKLKKSNPEFLGNFTSDSLDHSGVFQSSHNFSFAGLKSCFIFFSRMIDMFRMKMNSTILCLFYNLYFVKGEF